jgi:hypothetical protein
VASLILDAGALIAIDRGERRIGAVLHEAARTGVAAITSSASVAQVWRDPARQARLARAMAGLVEAPLDQAAARRCGTLLARTGTSDIADAAVVLLAITGDVILTSDPDDIDRLVAGSGHKVRVETI